MSKIKRIEIENFMSIEKGILEFDEKGIVSICGYNNVGKSAITRSIEVMLYNSDSSDQVKYIKDEEDYFRLKWLFEDGVELERYKYRNGASVWELSRGGEVLYNNRLDTRVASTGGEVPEVIKTYLGVIIDEHTGEELNVRRNTDKLFLINTTGGDNYKILNSILKSDVLAEASMQVTKDKNKKQKELEVLEIKKGSVEEELQNLRVLPEEKELRLEREIEKLEDQSERLGEIEGVKGSKRRYEEIKVYDKLEEVEIKRLEKVEQLKVLKDQSEVKIPKKVGELKGVEKLEKLEELSRLKKKVSEKLPRELEEIKGVKRLKELENLKELEEQSKVKIPKELKEIREVKRLKEIREVGVEGENIRKIEEVLKKVENRYRAIMKELEGFRAEGYKICQNCGSAII